MKLLLLVFFLVGCSAPSRMVVSPRMGTESAYSPVNEKSRPGLIKYSAHGSEAAKERKREDAYWRMHNACGGAYRILSEVQRSDGGAYVPVGNMMVYSETQYVYIEFLCEGQR